MAKFGGWTGKVLRVNLTTGKISSEDTFKKYMDYLGGEGLGFKVLWDEVPPGTHAHDEANKIIFGAGPFNGTGIPHAGRLSITSLYRTCPYQGPGTGHAGGFWTAQLKFAGWDAVIVEGKAPHPVWICIDNENVSIRDARKLWGHGTFYTQVAIMDEMGHDNTSVLSIGQAGENLLGSATIIIDRFGSGQNGSVMGAKNLKAIGVRGTGSVPLACSGKELLETIMYHTYLCGGAGSGGMTPSTPQPWAEYYGGANAWHAREGLWWGGATPPIHTGNLDPKDVNNMALRGPGNRAGWDKDEKSMRLLVRGQSCFGCPTPCRQAVDAPHMKAQYGTGDRPLNECGGISTTRDYYGSSRSNDAMYLGSVLADDYGIGDDYHILTGDFCYYLDKGIIKHNLPEAEYNSLKLKEREKGDPEFIRDLLRRLAYREGELGYAMGLGSYEWYKRWENEAMPTLEEQWKERGYGKAVAWNKTSWFAPHHFEYQQVGVILNSMYNRDPCMHEQTHFWSIADEVNHKVYAQVPGIEMEHSVDPRNHIKPINEAKIRLAVRMSADGVINNSLCMCNRGNNIYFSPHRERNYVGDSGLMAKYYSLVTGDKKTELQFVDVGLRIFNLMRALTMRQMGTKDMRSGHDRYPDAAIGDDPSKIHTPGYPYHSREDLEKSFDMYYDAMGWNRDGSLREETLKKLGMDDVAEELKKLALL